MSIEKEFKNMEKELDQKARKVEVLLDVIKRENSRVPASINDAVNITERLNAAKDELVSIVGMDEYQRLMGEIEHHK